MADTTLFAEIFPIENPPTVYLFTLELSDTKAPFPGTELAHRLRQSIPGEWVWTGNALMTTADAGAIQLEMAVDVLKDTDPQFAPVQSVSEGGKASPVGQAIFVALTRLKQHEPALYAALAKNRAFIKNGVVERSFTWQALNVMGEPALALSIRSHVKYNRNVQQLINDHEGSTDDIIGLRVMDRNAPSMIGDITALTGTIGEQRDHLLALTSRPATKALLNEAGDEELVFQVRSGVHTYDYAARGLHILVQTEDDFERFNIAREQAFAAQRLRPDVRAGMVSQLSNILKDRNTIGNGYNARSRESLFTTMDFLPGVAFGNNRVMPYDDNLYNNFSQGGVFWQNPRFTAAPIRIAVINTLDEKVDDFIEAMRRQLEKDAGYQIELIKERRVRVVNSKNLQSAVRAVEKEKPHVVLAFFADYGNNSDEDSDANYGYLRSLTLGKGIASQPVYATTMHNPEAMPRVIMGLLAKTGNVPYALAEPLEYADFVVGLDIVRESLTRGDRVVAIARIYRNNGEFLAYIMDTLELETGAPIPFVLMQTLFPQEEFAEKRVIIHHDGIMDEETLRLLTRWQTVLHSHFHPVEIRRSGVPRLYALSDGISQPPRGSVFLLSDDELLVVAASAPKDATPQPLHIRCHSGLPVGQAAYSVLAWTLLHYGTGGTHKVPVSIKHADVMGQWLARGILPENTRGDVPFWL